MRIYYFPIISWLNMLAVKMKVEKRQVTEHEWIKPYLDIIFQ